MKETSQEKLINNLKEKLTQKYTLLNDYQYKYVIKKQCNTLNLEKQFPLNYYFFPQSFES